MSGRLKNVDVAKGMAMIAIVFLHGFICQPSLDNNSISTSPPLDFFYSGLMLFFIFSGYFYRASRSAGVNLYKRIIQITVFTSLLIVIMPLIVCAEFAIVGIPFTIDDFLVCLPQLWGGDNVFKDPDVLMSKSVLGAYVGYYYLQAIIVSFIIFYPTAQKASESTRNLVIAIALMLVLSAVLVGIVDLKLPFSAQLSPIGAAFMYLGAYLRKRDLFRFLETEWRTPLFWELMVAGLIMGVLLLVFLPPGHSFDKSYFGKFGGWSVFPFFITTSCCCYVLMCLATFIGMIPYVDKVVCMVGRHTLGILALHGFVIKLLTAPFFGATVDAWFATMPLGAVIASGLVTLVITTALSEVVSRKVLHIS